MPLEMTALCAFAWDFADRGVAATLERCRALGVSHLFLAVSYHAGYFLYPDNPVRRVHLLEDGAAYFRPRLEFYQDTPLRPVAAAMCAETDWVEAICARLDQFGLKLGAWTVCLHNTRLGLLHPECTVHNAFGESYPHALCPSHPHVQAYVRGLARELVSRFPVDVLLLEAVDYRGRRHGGDWVAGHHHERDGAHLWPLERALFDLSFASSDIAAAHAGGIDAEAVREAVRSRLAACLAAYPERPVHAPASLQEMEAAVPGLAAYRACLASQAEQLTRLVKEEVAPAGVQLAGAGAPAYDWLLVGAYGQSPSGVAVTIEKARAAARPEQKLLAGIRLGFDPPEVAAVHSQAQLAHCVAELEERGAGGVMFYNLAESPRACLDWIGPALRPAAPPAATPPLRIGLIGCGGISESYLRAARRVAGVAIHAVADVDLEQARHRAAQFGIPTVAATADLLAQRELDAVVIAVPPRWHAELFEAALRSGKHVLVEKPLGLDLAEADAMVDGASTAQGITATGLVHRYLPVDRALRDLIDAGALGLIRQVRLRTGRDMYTDPRFTSPDSTRGGWLTQRDVAGGGILMSSTIHLCSAASFLLGEPRLTTVNALVRRLHAKAYDGIEDDVTLSIQTETGVELLLEDSWVRPWPFALEILGEAGWVEATGPHWQDNVCIRGECAGPLPEAWRGIAAAGSFAVNAARCAGDCPPLFEGLLADFAASVRAYRPVATLPGVLHARNMQAVLAAAYESARSAATERIAWRM